MKYLLLAYGNEEKFNQMSKAELAEVREKCKGFDAEMQAAGEVTWRGSLSWDSKSMRLKDGNLTVTDGRFVEAKEVVGGVVIIEAPDLAAAVKLASLHPAASKPGFHRDDEAHTLRRITRERSSHFAAKF